MLPLSRLQRQRPSGFESADSGGLPRFLLAQERLVVERGPPADVGPATEQPLAPAGFDGLVEQLESELHLAVLVLLPVGGLALADRQAAAASEPGLLVFEEPELMSSAKVFENRDPVACRLILEN